MNTRLVNGAAGVINAALAQCRTAAGIALALESAGLLMTPETAAELKQLRARVAELEALTPAAIQTCRVCGAGYSYGNPCSTCLFKAQMAAATAVGGCPRNVIDGDVGGHFFKVGAVGDGPRCCMYCGAPETGDASSEGEHYAAVHHTYKTPRDLPELGGHR